jgi:hypothetical protein
MAQMHLFKADRKISNAIGKTICFLTLFLSLSWLAWADIYEKIDELSLECREGNKEACAELADIAKNDEDGNVRLAAAEKLQEKSLAQTIFASIANYDKDAQARAMAVKKLSDKDLLENLANYAKDNAVREAATRKLNGEDISAEVAENVKGENANEDEEADVDEQVSEKEANEKEVSEEIEPAVPANKLTVVLDRKRDGKGKKMGLYTFELPKMGYKVGIGILGILEAAAENAKIREAMPYLKKLRSEFIKVTEDVFIENDIFQFIPTEKLVYFQSDQLVSVDDFLRKNDLYASISVKIVSWGGTLAIRKKMLLKMHWAIRNSSGYEVKIKTYCKSKDSIGVFPDPIDPSMEPVLVELARENARQFLEKLAVILQEDKNLQ